MTVQPQPETVCEVCGTTVAVADGKCPTCGLTRPGVRGFRVLGRDGLLTLGAMLVAIYAIALLIVAAAR
jgi:hypothetical protein